MGVALLAALLGGCSAGGRASSSSSDAGAATQADARAGGLVGTDSGVSASTPPAATVTQQMVVTGSVTLSTSDPASSQKRLGAAVEALGGTTSQANVSGQGASARAGATYRIPANSYQRLIDSLGTFGTVTDLQTNSEDVGAQVTDLEARIKALRTSIARLGDLMAKATSTSDLLEAESQMTSRQADLDSLTAQRTWLAEQVSMSTLTATFTSDPVRGDPSGSVWQRSWGTFVSGMKDVVVGLIWVAPWLIVLVPALALLWWVARARGRRASRREVAAGVPEAVPADADPATGPDTGSATGPE